jgi:hypothetical protein
MIGHDLAQGHARLNSSADFPLDSTFHFPLKYPGDRSNNVQVLKIELFFL